MAQLNGRNRVLFFDEIGKLPIHRYVFIVPDTGAFVCLTSARLDTGLLAEDDPGTADR